MKILPHKNLFIGITEALSNVFFNHKYADREVERMLKSNSKWGSKDRAFVAETIYDCVRWRRLIEASMGRENSPENIWEFVGTWFVLQKQKLPPWEEFKRLNHHGIAGRKSKAMNDFAVRESIPDWLNELGINELGKKAWGTEIIRMNQKIPTVIRVNTLKTDRKKLQEILENEDVKTEIIHFDENQNDDPYPEALALIGKPNITRTDAFKNGLFEIQDAGSQLIAPFLKVEPGMRIVDACAGAGGKTLHLSALMQNKGQIYALDIHDWKLNELKKRAKRNGVQNIQTKRIDSTKVIKRLAETADRLLIDAPCSGLGVLSRNPGAKWKLTQEFIDEMMQIQQRILDEYAVMVKPGGAMVYATCSILPGENQRQVAQFLKNHTEFKLIEEKQHLPSETGFDGFYMAYLTKKNEFR